VKRGECGHTVTLDDLSRADREEIERFKDFLSLVHTGKSQPDAYADLYGEVVFEAPAVPEKP